MSLSFDKYHGIGNDFLVVTLEDPSQISVERAIRLCDRHFGVGGDGVLIISPASSDAARAKMTVINSDGSTPEMCGNGLRCVALHLARSSMENRAQFVVETGAGLLACDVERDGNKALVGTEIGVGKDLGHFNYDVDGATWTFARISTGNPHAICFREPIDSTKLDQVGAAVSGMIEGGANVEIATQKSPQEIVVSVWERGVGRTLACGTGAAATAIAAVQKGLSPAGEPILVRLPGGPLTITVTAESAAHLRGPAEWVYQGKTEL